MMTAHTLTAALGGAIGGMPHRRPRSRCLASGWRVRHSCSDHGLAVCPLCAQEVPAREDRAHPGAVVIGGHR